MPAAPFHVAQTTSLTPPPASEGAARSVDAASCTSGSSDPTMRQAAWRGARLAATAVVVAKTGHDLRGVLSGALLSAERLQVHADPAVQRAGDVLVDAVERAAGLMTELLAFTRDAGWPRSRTRCSLNAVAAQAAACVRLDWPGAAVAVAGQSGIEIEAEPAHVLSVLVELLRNAAEAGAGSVRIDIAEGGGAAKATVTDDAGGLPGAVQERLFLPFAASGKPGFGLAIARETVRAARGDLRLLSTGATGTAFVLSFPAAPNRQPPEALQTSCAPPPNSTSRCT